MIYIFWIAKLTNWLLDGSVGLLVTSGHNWSHGLKHLLDCMVDNLAVRWDCRAASQNWSQLVTADHIVRNIY